jgi:UDP-glucose 4-epimerase
MTQGLAGSTVLVTGGAGLVGSHIVDQLLAAGAGEVRVLDNLVRGRREHLAQAEAQGGRRLRFTEADIRDPAAVDRAVDGCDYVLHQAALRITLCAERPRECLDVLVGGTANVLDSAIKHGVRKVVYASSASVYGAAESFPTPEAHHPYGNRTLYGAAKLMNEGLARSYREMHGLASVGLRYFNVYGPRMDVTGAYTEVFVRWLEAAERCQPPIIHGDGSATMDCVYVKDVARANLLALVSDRQDDVYNVASGVETSLLALWHVIRGAAGRGPLAPTFQPPRKVNPVPRRLADTELAWRELGFRSEVPLEEGVRRLAAWRRAAVRREAA